MMSVLSFKYLVAWNSFLDKLRTSGKVFSSMDHILHLNSKPGIEISPFCWTEQFRYLHLKTEAEPAPETYCIQFSSILNDGSSPKKQQYWK
jgi:hypothetical protein